MIFEILFWILFVMVFGRLITFAFQLCWGFMQIALILIAMPLMLVALLIGGTLALAFPFLAFIGLVTLICSLGKKKANA